MFLSSLFFSLLAKLKIWQTTETYSPQTFSVTAAVVAPAVVIFLNSLITHDNCLRYPSTNFFISIFPGTDISCKAVLFIQQLNRLQILPLFCRRLDIGSLIFFCSSFNFKRDRCSLLLLYRAETYWVFYKIYM